VHFLQEFERKQIAAGRDPNDLEPFYAMCISQLSVVLISGPNGKRTLARQLLINGGPQKQVVP
jgi:hypothetical protein